MKQRFLSIFLVLALIIPFFPQVTLPAKAAETTAKTQDENSNDRDHKEGSIGSITDGTRIGKKEEGNKNGFTIMDTAPVDAKGEGQKRYVAVLGYWLGGKRLELYIADKDGNRVSNTYAIGGEKTLDYLEQADAFEDTGFVSVAAGDFNGDGKDTVIAYAPLMESDSEQPQLWEFSIGSNMQLEKTGTVCNIFDILGTGNIATKHSNNGKVFRNTPVVQMTTADTDKDSVDELVVTAGMNNTKADVNNRQSRMFIYDNITEEEKSYWNKTFELDTKGYNNGNQRLRWASSSVGNLVMTGSGADYPEIITAGWVDKKTNKDADLTHDIGAYVTSCSKTTKKGNSAIGTYAKSEVPAIGSNGQPQVSGFTKDGHYRDDVQSLVVVDTFAADGVNAEASVLIMDTIYTYEAGKGLNEEYRTDYFNHSDNGIGTSIITNGLVQDAVSGNFSGNEEGREQIVFTTCQKRASKNQYFYKTYTYKKTGKSSWQYNSTGYRISKKGNAYTSLCAPDIDSDSTIARIKDVSLTYTEPEVLALLESTPYFSEVDEGDIGNSETAYGKENGEGDSVSTAEGLTTNIVAGFEWSVDDICAGFVCGAGFETSVEQGYTWETATSTTKKFSLNYSNDTGENQVIVYRRPVTTYRYEIKGTKDTMVLARQGTLLTSMLPVDEYNEAAQSYELEEIADGTLATPGNPFSYRSSTAGLNNVAESKITTQYGKEGTVTQEFSTETEQEKTFTYDLNASFTAYGLVFGVKAGGGAGTTYSESQSTINTEAITKTGAVTGKQVEGYDFNWKFAHWTTKVNGTEIPVLGYVLTNVIAPPSPPENLAVESVTSDSAKITWDAGERGADEYRIYQIYSDGSDIQIGTVDGTESTYEVTGLKPDTSYTYAIKAYKEGKKGDAISGESVFSEKLIVTTLPEKMGTVTITNPEDTSVKIGGSAVFKADLSSTASDYRATNYKWQRREKGGKWQTIDGANGKIVSAVAGKVDQIANIETGFVLASGATVDITAQPDTGYKVGCWKVNGKVVDGQTGNTYTYTADENGTGAAITVQFVQIDYAVSWSAVNGTVKAEDTSGTEYEGNKADIRGGSKVTFSATPKEAYKVSCWKVNGKVVDGENANTFTFTVPSGAKETPEVASYKVEAVCEKDQFTLTYAQPSNGTLTARGAAGEVASGDKVNGDEKYTFTVKPDADYIVESWKVDGQVIDSYSTSYEVTVKKNTEVSVQLVPASYKVTYKVNNEQGKLLVGKDTEEKTDGEISAAYGTSIKFTAVSNKFCHIKGWKLDGTEVTDTTEGISISADGSELTLSEVKKEHSVEAIFDAATMYEVSYEVDETSEGVASNAGTLNAKAGNTDLKLKKDQTTTVEGGKTLTFTAVPVSADFMVAGWYVNGKKVENELSNTCVIEKLDKKVHLTVQFTQYKGYALPVSGEGYALSEMKRTPDDTTPDTEIRENGTLSFKVAPDTDNKYIRIDKLVINGYDCLADKLSEGKEQPENCTLVEVQKNEDGSYVITVSGITGEIQTDITAHKHTLKKVDKVNPTCTKAGNKEYWICEDENCKEMFLEEAAMKAVQWEDILLPATGHNYQNGICKNCGAKDPTYVDIHPGTPKVKAKAKGDRKIKLSWSKAKDAQGYIVYRYNAKTRKYAVIANTKKTAYTDKKRTPGTVYRYLVKAYGVSLNKKVIYGQVSNCASAVTKPQTPKITSVKKAGTTKAAIQLKTERNVKGYQLYEYMWQTKKFKLVGKIEGKKYYKYDSKKKKFTRDRKSKVVQNAKKKTISVKITTNNVNFKRYRRYRFKVRSYVKYNGKQIFSKLSKQKIVTR